MVEIKWTTEIENFLEYRENKKFFKKIIEKYPEQAIVINDGEKILALGIFWEDPLHPESIYFDMGVSFDISYKEEMLEEVFNQLTVKAFGQFGEKHMLIEVWQTKRELINFCHTTGFRIFRFLFRTHMTLSFFEKHKKKTTGTVYTLGDMRENPKLLAELLCILEENYEETHRENPLREMTQQEWINLIFTDNPLTSVPAVIVKGGHVMSFAICFEKEGEVDLSWFGCEEGEFESLDELIYLLGDSLFEKGFKELHATFETTDSCAMYVLGAFPFKETPSKVLFQKRTDEVE